MYRVKISLLCLVSSLILSAESAQAHFHDPDAQLRTFAACVGRLSAVAEHEWNTAGTVSPETTRRHHAVVEIVAAIIPMDRSRDVLHWRNAAKEAQWNLLLRADAANDSAEASWAFTQAERFEQECTGLLTL